MSNREDSLVVAWWTKNLDEVDLEIAREAMLCQAKLLDPGVIDRVLRNDASVCGVDNPAAFAKMRRLLMMHYAILKKTVDELGGVQAAQIQTHVIDRLRNAFAAVMGASPAA